MNDMFGQIQLKKGPARHRVPQGHYCSSLLVANLVYHGVSLIELEVGMPSYAHAEVMPYWEETIAPMLKQGKTVFVAAHGNSIRAIVKMRLGSGIVVKWLRFKPAGVYSIWLNDSWCNGALT